MLHYIVRKTAVASYVNDLLETLGIHLQSITITTPEKSEDCFVLIVISSSSVDAVKEWTSNYYGWQYYT